MDDKHLESVVLPTPTDEPARKLKPIRVPENLYNDFVAAVPFKNVGYNGMMINLMVYYLMNQEEVNAFINNLTPNARQLGGE